MKSNITRQHRVAKLVSATAPPKDSGEPPPLNTNEKLCSLIAKYQDRRRPITINFRKLIPQLNYSDRCTHLVHPYPAKLLAHIPAFFLANDLMSQPGDIVLDPFCGSGTVLIEGQLAKRHA